MKRVLVIGGPTAVGKTAYALVLARQLNGEIINADSMQVYRGFDLGTAKIKPEEQAGVPHHLFDICDPSELFDVAAYQVKARQTMAAIHQRGRLPILVGGSGLYLRAALYDYHFPVATLEADVPFDMENFSPVALHQQLACLDSEAAKMVHPNNRKRVERAIKRYYESGPIAPQREPALLYDVVFLGLQRPRAELYARINARVRSQLEQGLEQEARRLLPQLPKRSTARQAIGYKEFIPYWEGTQTLVTTLETIQRNTRRYAKRQNTWFQNQFPMQWIDVGNERSESDVINEIKQCLEMRWPT